MGIRKGGWYTEKVQASAKTQKPAGTFGSDYNGSLLATEINHNRQQQFANRQTVCRADDCR